MNDHDEQELQPLVYLFTALLCAGVAVCFILVKVLQ